jgi:serine protease inhibitor
VSASIALSMTYAGARGRTADAFKSVLGGEIDAQAYHLGVNKLVREIASRMFTEITDGTTHARSQT